MELKRKLDTKTEQLKIAEEKVTRAAESGALTDEKIAEIVTQLGMANAEKDELVGSNNDKDKIIKELTDKVAAMQNRRGFLLSRHFSTISDLNILLTVFN